MFVSHSSFSLPFRVGLSENGWTNDNQCLKWLETCFIPQARERAGNPDKPILLFVDGHGSHVTREMIELARQHNVHIVRLPPHTTHMLQPLDVGCFGLLQRKWIERCERYVETFGFGIPRRDVVREYFIARKASFTAKIIKAAWKRTGLYPFNPNIFTNRDFAPSHTTSTKAHVPPSFPAASTSQVTLDDIPPLHTLDEGNDEEVDNGMDIDPSDDGWTSPDESEAEHGGGIEDEDEDEIEGEDEDEEDESPEEERVILIDSEEEAEEERVVLIEGEEAEGNARERSAEVDDGPDSDKENEQELTVSSNQTPDRPTWNVPSIPSPKRPQTERIDRRWPLSKQLEVSERNRAMFEEAHMEESKQRQLYQTHCLLAAQEIGILRNQLYARKETPKRQRLHCPQVTHLTGEEAMAAYEKQREAEEEDERVAQAKAAEKAAVAEETQKRRAEHAKLGPAVRFEGKLTTKKKGDLEDIAVVLGLPLPKENAKELLSRITSHFDANDTLKSDPRFVGMFSRRVRKSKKVPARPAQPRTPSPPAFPVPSHEHPPPQPLYTFAGLSRQHTINFSSTPHPQAPYPHPHPPGFEVEPQAGPSSQALNHTHYPPNFSYSYPYFQ